MRPANLLLFFLPLAGCDPASAGQCGSFEQNHPSTGIDPTELLGLLSRLVLISRDMRLEALEADEQTASETLDNLLGGISVESHTLASCIPRLSDTAPFECASDRYALATTFGKWQTTTGALLLEIYKSSETLQRGALYHTSRLAIELADFRNTTALFSSMFRIVMSGTDVSPTVGPTINMTAVAMDTVFQETIRQLRKKAPLRG